MIKDVHLARNKVVANLEAHGFKTRDADPTDFQFGDDQGLRFKVGTAYSEVTVTVWRSDRQRKTALRATSDEQVVELNHDVDALIARWFSKQGLAEGENR